MKKWLIIFWLICSFSAVSQNFIIKGKIVDAVSLDPVPFAALSFKNSFVGRNSDFDGTFTFQLTKIPSDSLIISCIGFARKSIYISPDSASQQIKIFLKPAEIALQEIKVFAGENPAYSIIRKAVAAKADHNYKNIAGYDYSTYSKIEVDINNLNPKLQNTRLAKKVNKAIEKVGKLEDEAGNALVPRFISESISHYYHRSSPNLSKEIIEKTNITDENDRFYIGKPMA